MRAFLMILAIGLIGTSYLKAEFIQPIFDAELAVGYRRDNFKWSFKHPEVLVDGEGVQRVPKLPLFEMFFENMQIYEISSQVSYGTCNNYYVRANADWGQIYKGKGRTSSFTNINEPEEETSRITGKVNNGHVMDFTGGVGYQFTSNGQRCIVSPIIGWSYNEQHFIFSGGDQIIDRVDTPRLLGSIPGLNAKYTPRWYGFWFGTDFLASLEVPCLLIFGSVEYHLDQFRASGNWNYSNLFSNSFKQKGHGHGVVGYFGFNYRIACHWYLGVVGYYRNFQMTKGKNRHVSSQNTLMNPRQGFGTMPVAHDHKHASMKRAKWNSWSIALAVDYRFYD